MKYAYSTSFSTDGKVPVAAAKSTLHLLILLILLAIVWVICSGFIKPFFLVSGVLSCVLVVWIVHRMHVVDEEGQPVHLTMRSPLFLLWLLKEMVVASLHVSRLSLRQNVLVSPGFAKITSAHGDDVAHTVYANSITMTPGTVTVSVLREKKHTEFLVHALEQASVDDLQEGRMSRRVQLFVQGDAVS